MMFPKTQTALVGLLAMMLTLSGCQLVVDFDRSRIGEDAGDNDAGDDAAPADAGDDAMDAGLADAGDDADLVDAGDSGLVDAGDDAMDTGPVDAGDDAPDAGDDAGPPECTMPSMCNDAIACTVDTCDAMSCVHMADDAMCDDSNICTVNSCDTTEGCEVTDCTVMSASMRLISVVRLASVHGGEGGLLLVAFDSTDMPIGATIVPAGMNTDLDIELTRDAEEAEVLTIQLFMDAGVIGTFEAGTDIEALTSMAMIVSTMLTVELLDVPAFEVRVAANGDSSAYVFTEARPAGWVAEGAEDPVLTFVRGARYRIINSNAPSHPFQFQADATILLDQQITVAPREDEASIGWAESVEPDPSRFATIEFTASAEFEDMGGANAIDGYRCASHAAMTGTVAYIDPS